MDLNDLTPKKPKGHEIGQDVSTLSEVELRALIESLEGEIARIEAVLSEKQSSRSAAEAAFKR